MTDTNNSKFNLSKWFLDCINEKGDVVIIYSAELRWNRIVIPYNSVLICKPDGEISVKSRFKRKAVPINNEEQIRLNDTVFGVDGKWESDHKPLRATIYKSEDGFLIWRCFQPRSKVMLEIKNIGTYAGFGYVEKLDMTIEPWKIPMNQLRWGRFNSESDNLVWIEIISKNSRQWVWHNGELFSGAEIDDEKVRIPETGLELTFTKTRILESGNKISNVVSSILSYIPGLHKIIPLSFLNASEVKYVSYGRLLTGNNNPCWGWAIHEHVDF